MKCCSHNSDENSAIRVFIIQPTPHIAFTVRRPLPVNSIYLPFPKPSIA